MKTTLADDSVNVNRYTIYAMIPGLDSYVALKLDKKKFASIYTGIFIVGILTLTGVVMYQIPIDYMLSSEMDKTKKAVWHMKNSCHK